MNSIMLHKDDEVRVQDIDAIALVEQQLARPWTLVPELLVKADWPAIQVHRMIQKALD